MNGFAITVTEDHGCPPEVGVSVAPFALHQRAILDTTLTLTPIDGSADLAEASLDISAQPESLAIVCAARGDRNASGLSSPSRTTKRST